MGDIGDHLSQLALLLRFCVGIIGFGGVSVLIPVIEGEIGTPMEVADYLMSING